MKHPGNCEIYRRCIIFFLSYRRSWGVRSGGSILTRGTEGLLRREYLALGGTKTGETGGTNSVGWCWRGSSSFLHQGGGRGVFRLLHSFFSHM